MKADLANAFAWLVFFLLIVLVLTTVGKETEFRNTAGNCTICTGDPGHDKF